MNKYGIFLRANEEMDDLRKHVKTCFRAYNVKYRIVRQNKYTHILFVWVDCDLGYLQSITSRGAGLIGE